MFNRSCRNHRNTLKLTAAATGASASRKAFWWKFSHETKHEHMEEQRGVTLWYFKIKKKTPQICSKLKKKNEVEKQRWLISWTFISEKTADIRQRKSNKTWKPHRQWDTESSRSLRHRNRVISCLDGRMTQDPSPPLTAVALLIQLIGVFAYDGNSTFTWDSSLKEAADLPSSSGEQKSKTINMFI